jgi:hypothetical protein
MRATIIGRSAITECDALIIHEVASLGKTYVEIGTLFGGSAIVAGLAGCEVFCIDPLDGYYSAKNKEERRPDPVTQIVTSEKIVRSNWAIMGLCPSKLHIYKQLHPPWPKKIDRVFDAGLIDGDHSYSGAMADYMGMGPRVTYLMFHDVQKEGVRTVYEFALKNPVWELYTPKTFGRTYLRVLRRR